MIPGSLLHRLLDKDIPILWVEPDGQVRTTPRPAAAVLAGSFNPLHSGHVGLAETTLRLFGLSPVFELCVRNVDKPALTGNETAQRVAQFAWKHPLCLTNAPTFLDKARYFPGAIFLIGADTAERIIAPRYYSGNSEAMRQALREIQQRGCRFLVAGRRTGRGQLLQLADLPIPEHFLDLFQSIPITEFCLDISSTEIRNRQSVPHSHGRKTETETQP
jgi:nicotinic acid mononucleotide adenylyltransferase